MSKVMPQEIEVWYLIPALRRELVKIFIKDYNLSQKKSAEILEITESAISQYLKSKRGGKIIFSKKETEQIKKSADKIIKNPETLMKNLYDLCILFRKNKVICELHKNQDKKIIKDCDVCFGK
tara:strand:+ start:2588 stop:2956 length:369 start_codon:yes stop_codon:yes gene_type:complete